MKRNKTLDIAKFLGILCVYLGHRTTGPSSDFLYSFHMPLFFLITGYLMNKGKKNKIIDTKLVVSYFVYSIIFVVIDIIARTASGYNLFVNDILSDLIVIISLYGLFSLWFLPALCISKTIVTTVECLKNNVFKLLMVITIYTIGFFLTSIVNNLSFCNFVRYLVLAILRSFETTIFVFVGYESKKYVDKLINYLNQNLLKKYLVIIFSTVTTLFLSNKFSLDYNSLNYGNIFLTPLTGVCGSLMIILISTEVNRTVFCNMFCFFGSKSLYLMTAEYYNHIIRKVFNFEFNITNRYIHFCVYLGIVLLSAVVFEPLITKLINIIYKMISSKKKRIN